MATEDFTTYTEVDPNSHISKTADRVTGSNVTVNEACYVYADKGAAHFGDFEHLITIQLTSADNGALFGCWSITNGSHTLIDMDTGSDGIACQINPNPATAIHFRDWTNANIDSGAITNNTLYYLTLKRATTTGTLKIYSDAARTNLLDTLAITTGAGTYQYIHPLYSYENTAGGGQAYSGFSENLDLQEAPPPPAHFMQASKYW